VEGLGGQKQYAARVDDLLSVPYSLRNHTRLPMANMENRFVVTGFEIRSQKQVNCAFEQIQEFVLFGMHLPFVTHPGRRNGQNAYPTTIELHGQELNRGNGAIGRFRVDNVHGRECYRPDVSPSRAVLRDDSVPASADASTTRGIAP
jgi:hypothetical protein